MSFSSRIHLTLLIGIATAVFLANTYLGNSYLGTPKDMAAELRAPVESIYEYGIAHEAPFKYRALFPRIVLFTWNIFADSDTDNETFIVVYIALTYLTLLTAVISFYFLLKTIGFSAKVAFIATLVYTLLPAISFAHTSPVHTREDLLGFTLLHLGLINLLRHRIFLFALISVVAATTRETLLILPFVYLFFGTGNFFVRGAIAAIPVLSWVVMRVAMGHESYDIFGMGLFYNLDNIFQTFAFSIICFNALWLFFFTGLVKHKPTLSSIDLFYRSALPVLALIIASTFILGRMTEIRLMYLAAPWLFAISIHVIEVNRERALAYVKSSKFILIAVGSFVALGGAFGAAYVVMPRRFDMIEGYWWTWLIVSLWLCVISLPLVASFFRNKPAVN